MNRITVIFLLAIAGLLVAACTSTPEPEAPQTFQGQADFVLVDKSDRTLTLMRDGNALKTYVGVGLGDAPQGHKQFEGDERTPEGRYTVDYRNPNSSYHLSLHISYPNAADTDFAAEQGKSAGGEIFIHGQPNWLVAGNMTGDWTDGCIAVSNAEIEEMWAAIPNGTGIEIVP